MTQTEDDRVVLGVSRIEPLIDDRKNMNRVTDPDDDQKGRQNIQADGEWDVEGYGVDPDYEVDAMPEDMYKGMDAQLTKAIELIKASLKENPPIKPGQTDPYSP